MIYTQQNPPQGPNHVVDKRNQKKTRVVQTAILGDLGQLASAASKAFPNCPDRKTLAEPKHHCHLVRRPRSREHRDAQLVLVTPMGQRDDILISIFHHGERAVAR